MIHRRHLLVTGLAVSCGVSHAAFKGPLDFAAAAVRLPQQRSLLSIAIAGNRLVAVGMRGLIIASEDDGISWQQVPLALSSDLVSVTFVSKLRGWACGHDGVILTTKDAGRTWAVQLKGLDFASILTKHYERAVAAGHPGAEDMLKSIKLGFEAGPEQPVLGVWFDDEFTGWMVSTFGMILGTTDGGKSWSSWMDQVDNPDLLHFYTIAGVAGEVYIASERGKIFRLDRTLRQFVRLDTGYSGGLFGLVGSAGILLAFGLQGTALRSRDGGVTWQRLETGLRAGLNAGAVLPDGRMVIVSQDGQMLVTADQGSSFLRTRVPRPGLLTGVAVAPSGQLIVVGFNGVQLHKA